MTTQTPSKPVPALAMCPTPSLGPDFFTSYDSVREALSGFTGAAGPIAQLVCLAHDAGVIPDTELSGLTDNAAGRSRLATLGSTALAHYTAQAQQRAYALLADSGLTAPDEAELQFSFDLIAGGWTDHGSLWHLGYTRNCRIFDLDVFFESEPPAVLHDLAQVTLARASLVGPLAIHAADMVNAEGLEPEDIFMSYGLEELCEWYAAFESNGAPPTLEDARAHLRALDADDDLGPHTGLEESLAALDHAWERATYSIETAQPALARGCSRSRLKRLLRKAESAGYIHPILGFARAVLQMDGAIQKRAAELAQSLDVDFFSAAHTLIISTTQFEFDFAAEQADMMLQCGDQGSGLTVAFNDASELAETIELVSYGLAQALLLESGAQHHGLTVPYDPSVHKSAPPINRAA